MRLGFVVIGRNEGPRLRTCLESLPRQGLPVVYVDSSSTDDSVAVAAALGVRVVRLDPSVPLSPGRARNEGLKALLCDAPDLEGVHFVDGDCELLPGWVDRAAAVLEERTDAAAVCGRLYERHPDASPYNRLAEIEWTTTPGDVEECGGLALFRVDPFRLENGFDTSLVSGEEPDLCARLRRRGFRIVRIGDRMALHDAAMHRFGQWWRRCMRFGFGCAQTYLMRRDGKALRHVVSGISWGLVLPVVALSLLVLTHGLSAALLLAYPWLAFRVARHMHRRGFSASDARLYGSFVALSKLPQALGSIRCAATRLLGRKPALIEYEKDGPAATRALESRARRTH